MTGGAGRDQFWINESVIPSTPHVITDFQLGIDSVVAFVGNGIQTISQGTDVLFQTTESAQAIAIVKNVNPAQFMANINNMILYP